MAAASLHTVYLPVPQDDFDRNILLLQSPDYEIKNDNDDSVNCLFILQHPIFTKDIGRGPGIPTCNIFKIMNLLATTHQQIIEIFNLTYGSDYGFIFQSGDSNFLVSKVSSILPGQAIFVCTDTQKYYIVYHNINPDFYRIIYCCNNIFIDCNLFDPSCQTSLDTVLSNAQYHFILSAQIPFPY